jgi:hypothetical protein
MNIIKYKIHLITTYLFLFLTNISKAQSSLIDTSDPSYRDGSYELNDFIELIIRASDLILRFVGSLALLFFIYGGFMFMFSSGSTEQVSKAKGIIKASVIGLILVFASFLIIRFVLIALNVDINWEGGLINL